MNVGSLFSGIGGFDLGLERAGMRVVWQCEQDEFCRRVLRKHWPDIVCYSDVRLLGAGEAHAPDVLCGGFPCQDISGAGKRTGIGGERSGLWSEYARLVGEFRPHYVVVENVADLLVRGLGRVLGDLAALGYDAEWDCIPASAFGAPHRRDRLWLVAYPARDGRRQGWERRSPASDPRESQPVRTLQMAYPAGSRLEGRSQPHAAREARAEFASRGPGCGGSWPDEPDLPRVADGIPDWVDRMRATGNALVPQIAEWIGRRIMSFEAAA